MCTTTDTSNQIASVARREALQLKLQEWMKERRNTSSDCVSILWLLTGTNSYMAEDEIREMRSFFVSLMAFFCRPGNADRFNKLPGLYSKDDWPEYLARLVDAFTLLEGDYPKAELYAYEARNFSTLLNHQVSYIEETYQID